MTPPQPHAGTRDWQEGGVRLGARKGQTDAPAGLLCLLRELWGPQGARTLLDCRIRGVPSPDHCPGSRKDRGGSE